MMHDNRWLCPIGLVFLVMLIGCKGDPPRDRPHQSGKYIDVKPTDESAYEAFPPASRDHFADIDGKVVKGEYKRLSDVDAGGLTKLEITGRNAWMLWTGGNEVFWDWLSKNGYGSVDLLKVIDSNNRADRFAKSGLINEPGMRAPTDAETEAAYGIRYDRPTTDYYTSNPTCKEQPDEKVYGYPTGILGLRIFKNPEFVNSKRAQNAWESNKHRFYSEKPEDKTYASNPSTIKPYIVGMSCAICHVSHHPLNPPLDPEKPKWENISSTIGAQYLRIRRVFGNTLEEDSILYQAIDSQLPGTVDTSLISTDSINNANTMNALFDLNSRLTRSLYNPPETLSKESYGPPGNRYPGVWDSNNDYNQDGDYPATFAKYKDLLEYNPRHVPRVLVDGSDSLGTWVALARVYLNIGTYHQQWIRTHNTILGGRPQNPFSLADCEANSVYWHATRIRIDAITAYFLKSTDAMLLKDAIVNAVDEKGNEKVVERFPRITDGDFTGLPNHEAVSEGRRVFAKGCIACHSSKQPDYDGLDVFVDDDDILYDTDDEKNKVVKRDGKFYKNESNEEVYPVVAKPLRISDLRELTQGGGELPLDYAQWAKLVVEKKGYWEDNYLSTDMRIPVTITETNSARAMGTNAKHGHVWEDFASNTFKDLDSVGSIKYRDPFSGAENSFRAPSGGPGYYRVPTLISAWATAPFLHNNSLGTFNNDPSVSGRLEAFYDAIEKLLWPEKRLERMHDLGKLESSEIRPVEKLQADGGLIWRTSKRTVFKIDGHQVPSFLAGFTGYTRFWVRLIPWIPSLAFLFIGVCFLMGDLINRVFDRIENRGSLVKFSVMLVRVVGALFVMSLGIALAYFLYQYYSMIRMVEVGSGWRFPWIVVQLTLTFALLFYIVWLLLSKRTRASNFTGGFFIVAAVIFALGVGRFASGRGGDLAVGPFPKGMPVSLIANFNIAAPLPDVVGAVKVLTEHFQEHGSGEAGDDQELLDFEQNVAPLLLKVSNCPDLVLDRGHDYKFIRQLTDDEKKALITLIKTF